jgi:hypothetical protein
MKRFKSFLNCLIIGSLFTFMLSIHEIAFSQGINKRECCNHYDSITDSYVAKFVEQMPTFPGGSDSLNRFFRKNFYYPKSHDSLLQSIVIIGFVVDTNGNIIGGRIPRKYKKDLTLLDKEALKVLSLMPRWNPGECNNKKVPVYISLKWRIEPQLF